MSMPESSLMREHTASKLERGAAPGGDQHAVHPHADEELVLEGLDVDVRRPPRQRLGEHAVDEVDDRGLLGQLAQARRVRDPAREVVDPLAPHILQRRLDQAAWREPPLHGPVSHLLHQPAQSRVERMHRHADQGGVRIVERRLFPLVQDGVRRRLVLPGHRLALHPPAVGRAGFLKESFHLRRRGHFLAGLNRQAQLFRHHLQQVAFGNRAHAHQNESDQAAHRGLDRQGGL